MSIKEQIDVDLKSAMLAGNKTLVTTLRGIKSAILYAEVAEGSRETGGLDEQATISLLQKEAKKRQESADLYSQGGNSEKEAAELEEKSIIDKYLPEQLSEEEVARLTKEAIAELNASGMQDMGRVIAAVKTRAGAVVDGALVAKLVKEQLNS